MYVILDKGFQQVGLLLKLTKGVQTKVEFPFSEFFFTRSLLGNFYKSVQKFFCFVLFVVIKKNWRIWFFETCRHQAVLRILQYLLIEGK